MFKAGQQQTKEKSFLSLLFTDTDLYCVLIWEKTWFRTVFTFVKQEDLRM